MTTVRHGPDGPRATGDRSRTPGDAPDLAPDLAPGLAPDPTPQADASPGDVPPDGTPPTGDDVPHGSGRHTTGHGQGFGEVIGWTIAGSLVPGLGLLAAGRRRVGGTLVAVTVLLLLALGVAALVVDPTAVGRRLLTDPDRFLQVAGVLVVLVAAWAALVVVTFLTLRRDTDLTGRQQVLGVALVGAIVVSGAVPATAVVSDAFTARDVLHAVFDDDPRSRLSGRQAPQAAEPDPWAQISRENVLLMGGDSGKDRQGIRPDTIIVASIDTRTGDTVLISLPRNLQRVPFPEGSPGAREFPDGFQCINPREGANTECLLNSLWQWGDEHADDYPGDPHPGITATRQGVEQVTGLKIDEYVMLNLAGFQQVIDILGGLEVNVAERLPVGGSVEHPVASHWLEPGRQKLNGYYTLWYARSRWSTTDYDRMRRQRCVIGALANQIDPVTVALRFSQVAGAMKDNLMTSIPLQELDAWVTLGERIKHGHLRSLAFTDEVISTVHPDVEKMKALVAKALEAPATPSPTATTPTGPTSSGPTPTGPTPTGPTSTGKPSASSPTTSPSAAPSAAQDVAAVC